mgnify:CR=1 FL=1
MAVSLWEMVAQKFERTAPEYASPLDLAQALDPMVRRSPELELINDKLVEAFNTPDARLIISMPPQRGKSELCSHWFPVWALSQKPNTRIILASYQQGIARTFGRKVRDEFKEHADRLGYKVRHDLSGQSEWQLEGYTGGMYSAGVGGSLTSKPSDLMIIDDPVKGHEQANSKTIQDKNWEWWTGSALSRLATGANGAPVIMVLTRWSESDLAGQVMAHEPGVWDFVNIPAQADHDPGKGETDPLGREPGEWLRDVRGTTVAQWEARKRASGPWTWAALYQGRPAPTEGGIFPRDLPTYEQPLWLERPDGSRTIPGMGRDDHELVQSWDLALKGGASSDFVVGQVWLRVGANVYLVDQIRGRMDFNRTLQAVRDMTARWPQAGAKFIEDAANGPAVINSLSQTIPGIIPVRPDGGKEARAHAISPFMFSENVHFPAAALLSNVQDLREEMINFPNGAHDDTVDAMTQAINQLLLRPLLGGAPRTVDDLDVDPDDWTISDY